MSFDQFTVDPKCLQILKKQGITQPTPIQAKAIPVALSGNDIVAVAQTGTGKTLAFGLPSVNRLAATAPRRNRMLVLTPTRELCVQVHAVLEALGKAMNLRTVSVYGGVGMEPQTKALRKGCDIIIATPGRLLDHMGRGNVRFEDIEILVLDEADRMLDMGFLPDIRRILKSMPADRQTLLFSATFPDEISRLTREFMTDPERIEIAPSATPAEAVHQTVYTVDQSNKVELLARVLDAPDVTSAIVFIRTKHRTDRIAKQLSKKGFKAQAIHGDRSQAQRQRALDGFRNGKFNVLVATDVAARGIDVQGISHVVNFDIPGKFDDYIHRIGRTARASATGDAITFVTPQDFKELGAIEKALGRELPREEWEGAVSVPTLFRQKPAATRNGGPRRAGPRRAFRGRRPQRRTAAAS